MMRIGFYAPLKSPNHDIPSGDRAMARLFIRVLETSGHDVELISDLRSWVGTGSSKVQQNIRDQANQEVERLKQQYLTMTPPDLIFTYHVYHKAPDWIGVELANDLSIPYVMAEASFAPKQQNGPWHDGHEQTLKCIQSAKIIISLNPIDSECIQPLLGQYQSLELIKPFLDILPPNKHQRTKKAQTAEKYNLDVSKCWLITVAMMRKGDKQASYHQLAKTLVKLKSENWNLIVIGDGEASEEIRNYFSSVKQSCTFLGKLEQDEIYDWLSISDVFIWPAVNEAYGLALLEAQAYGLPVVAQDFGGVSSIVENNKTGFVTDPASTEEFQNSIERLISDENLRFKFANNAKEKFIEEHSFQCACQSINQIINRASNS